jgi:hypothetical protein
MAKKQASTLAGRTGVLRSPVWRQYTDNPVAFPGQRVKVHNLKPLKDGDLLLVETIGELVREWTPEGEFQATRKLDDTIDGVGHLFEVSAQCIVLDAEEG